jgi:hypothetical protein
MSRDMHNTYLWSSTSWLVICALVGVYMSHTRIKYHKVVAEPVVRQRNYHA